MLFKVICGVYLIFNITLTLNPFAFFIQAKGVKITVAGIGKKPQKNKKSMEEMAGEKGNLLLYADYEDLHQRIEEVLKAVCGV